MDFVCQVSWKKIRIEIASDILKNFLKYINVPSIIHVTFCAALMPSSLQSCPTSDNGDNYALELEANLCKVSRSRA